MPRAFWGGSLFSEEEIPKQRIKYDWMIVAFSVTSFSWSCLWCIRNFFAVSKVQLRNSVMPPDICSTLIIRDLPRDSCWEKDI